MRIITIYAILKHKYISKIFKLYNAAYLIMIRLKKAVSLGRNSLKYYIFSL